MTKTSDHFFIIRAFAALLILIACALVPIAHADVSSEEVPVSKIQKVYKIQIELDGVVISATLDDNPTVRDFIARLPLTLKLKDYASTEKIGFLPDKLTTQGAPSGSTPAVGDISYYAPWANLAIYYKDFAYSAELVKLGRVSSGIERLNFSGEKHATISLIHSN
ncbi:cyclophilin-like fold protein [Rheinheimera mangrovi]|uniref:cyclophilin-like fold protein n=1 Tax=Rheinheimera mangrovi TaxID=2498451 RepID=UPI000F8C575B|nr:cyclophilin-like fold protein [Rheinheimera mangrovi]